MKVISHNTQPASPCGQTLTTQNSDTCHNQVPQTLHQLKKNTQVATNPGVIAHRNVHINHLAWSCMQNIRTNAKANTASIKLTTPISQKDQQPEMNQTELGHWQCRSTCVQHGKFPSPNNIARLEAPHPRGHEPRSNSTTYWSYQPACLDLHAAH